VADSAPAFGLRVAGAGVAGLAITYAILAAVVPPRDSALPLTTYAGASSAAHTTDLAAGLGLLAAGLLAWAEPRVRRLGLLAMIAGVAWFGPDWEGWKRGENLSQGFEQGSAFVRSLGAAATPLFLALVFHLVLAFPSGRLQGRLARLLVAATYGTAALVSVGRALFRDPFLDPHCWRNCLDNSFLVHADQGLASALNDVWIRSMLAIGLLLVAVSGWRLLAASRAAKGALWPVLVPGVLVGASEAAYALALLRTPLEDPRTTQFSSIFLVLSFSVAALAAGLAWAVISRRKTRAAVSDLAAGLGEAPQPGTLREALAAGVGDPALEVAYWLPDSQRFVGADGKAVERPASGHGRAVTAIVREGRPIALVSHDAALLDGPVLEREIGSSARLAVENERLQAEVLAQLEDIRASRMRIVETGDAERRRLERDLHDGAQQRLLALSYDLRLALAGAQADGDPKLAAHLNSATDEAQIALEDLRELAHGIYPAVLTEAGLAAALTTLAEGAPLALELGEVPKERYDAPVETAAYMTVAEAIDDAVERSASFMRVDIRREGRIVVVTTEDDGTERSSKLVHLGDRIGALGGSLEAGCTTMRVEIPCV
jgi:signal transduction histidine kinase